MDDASTYPGITHVVTPDQALALRVQIDRYQQALTPAIHEDIERFVGKLAMAFPASKITDQEAEVRLEQYVLGLSDIPRDILGHAYAELIRTQKFFPTVAEIRERCSGSAIRKWQLSRMQMLLRTFDRHQ